MIHSEDSQALVWSVVIAPLQHMARETIPEMRSFSSVSAYIVEDLVEEVDKMELQIRDFKN